MVRKRDDTMSKEKILHSQSECTPQMSEEEKRDAIDRAEQEFEILMKQKREQIMSQINMDFDAKRAFMKEQMEAILAKQNGKS